MIETTNSSYMVESTTSQLLVYDPYKAFYTLADYGKNFDLRNNLAIFIGKNILTGEYNHKEYVIRIKDFFQYSIIEESKHLFVKNGDLNIEYIVESYDEILASILDELVFLWNTYAVTDDQSLTSDAIRLKQTILERYDVLRG
jgi:hypothetical protein